jgi:anti-sigma-K factor RskA
MNKADDVWKKLSQLARGAQAKADAENGAELRPADAALIERVLTLRNAAPSPPLSQKSSWDERLAWRVAIGALAASIVLLAADWQLVQQTVANDLPTPESIVAVEPMP